jgi:glycosyltransferase involved in cell wall biosynthesis
MPGASNPLVSFVVPCYNYGRFLPDCLGSIFAQEGGYDFEIVAVDDASTDDTLEILDRFREPRLRVIRHERNQGHAQTFTDGLCAARGELVARIDPDDRHRPYFLKRTVPVFAKYPEVGMVYGDASLIGDSGQEYAPKSDRKHGGRDFKGCKLIDLLEENFICAPTIIARRECFVRQLPVPPHLAFHDWFFTVKMARETEFYYVAAVLADYRVHSANLHSRIVLNKTEEPSIFWLLNQVYSSEERTPELQRRKLRAKGRIYGNQYRDSADKYFGAFMNADARRCYWQAIRHCPLNLLSPALMRRFLATLVGRSTYEYAKRLGRSISAPQRALPERTQ